MLITKSKSELEKRSSIAYKQNRQESIGTYRLVSFQALHHHLHPLSDPADR
jgi:hypothetical protein